MKKSTNRFSKAKRLLASLVSLSMVVGLMPTIVWADPEPKKWPADNMAIDTGGIYTCPTNIPHGKAVSGGTQDDPVRIIISGTVYAPSGETVFGIKSGYVEIIGQNNAKLITTSSTNNIIHPAESMNGDIHLTVKDVSFQCSDSTSTQMILLGNDSTNYTTTSYFENVSISSFRNNEASGAIFLKKGNHEFVNCSFTNCSGVASGGLSVRGTSVVTMTGCTFTNCYAGEENSAHPTGGGAIDIKNTASLTLDSCTFTNCGKVSGNNTVTGAVYLESGSLTLKGNTSITGNPDGNLCLEENAMFTIDPDFSGTIGVNVKDAPTSNIKRHITTPGSTDYMETLLNNGNILSDSNFYYLRYDSVEKSLYFLNISTPSIDTQPTAPSNNVYGVDGNRTMTVEASSGNSGSISYQWYSNTTNSTTGGTPIANATSNEYTIPSDESIGTHYYYCVVTNTIGGDSATNTTDVVEYTVVVETPSISSQPTAPANTSYGGDEDRTMSVNVDPVAEGTVTYQWYSNTTNSTTGGTPIANATSNEYAIPSDESIGTHYYYCEITNTVGNNTSTTTTDVIQVDIAMDTPSISSQPTAPANTSYGSDTDRTMSVGVDPVNGGTVTYQWYSNTTNSTTGGTPIANATSNEYAVPATESVGTHYYYCVVTNTVGNNTTETTSDVVVVDITKATPTVSVIPDASDVTTGEPLSSSTLSGGSASVPGTFSWVNSGTETSTCGIVEYDVIFTPDDTANYETVEIKVPVKVIGGEKAGERLIGYTLSLDGDIGVNFYMELSDDVIANEDSYMQFTIPSGMNTRIYNVPVKDASTRVINNTTYYIFKCNVSAKDMNSTIKAQIINGNTAGTEYEYTVKEYANYILTHTSSNIEYQQAAPLVKALLNYGAYAQIQLNNTSMGLANDVLAKDDQLLPEITSINHKAYEVVDLPEDVTFAGSYLGLKTETTLSLFFKNKSGQDVEFRFNGNVITPSDNNGYLQIDITNISSKDINADFTVTVGDSGSVTFSPMNYCQSILSGNYSTNMKNLVTALYIYSQEADAYFEN